MKNTSKNKTGNGNNATAELAKINAQIEALKQQRVGLAQPLKDRYAELRGELLALETEVRELDPNWKPEPLKVRPQTKIAEILTAKGEPMSADEIVAAVGGLLNAWKTKNTLKKKSHGGQGGVRGQGWQIHGESGGVEVASTTTDQTTHPRRNAGGFSCGCSVFTFTLFLRPDH